jgi:hypothetical protein
VKALAAINIAVKGLGLDDAIKRDLYERVTGRRSLRDMTSGQHGQVLDELRARGATFLSKRLTGPYARKLQALWISGWNLGVVRDRTDATMLAFVARQTGIEHTRFLRDAADARKAVEALKGWIAREGKVKWSEFDNEQDCVIAAQCRMLGLARSDVAKSLAEPDHIAVMQLLGRRVRASG